MKISLPYLKTNVKKVLDHLKLRDVGLEITLTNDSFMKTQNKKFMHKQGTTDVLSFPSIDLPQQKAKRPQFFKKLYLGEVLISLDQAQKQAKVQQTSIQKEILFLTLHSILHLIGHDHRTNKEILEMEKIQTSVWKKLYKSKHPKDSIQWK